MRLTNLAHTGVRPTVLAVGAGGIESGDIWIFGLTTIISFSSFSLWGRPRLKYCL